MKLLKVGDFFQELQVTRVSDSFCFFGNKRMSWVTIEKLIQSGEKVQFLLSPNKLVDWSNKENVLEYHSSFKSWNTYISGSSNKLIFCKLITEIKDSLVYYNDEYYLPAPISKHEDLQSFWNAKQDLIQNGKYNVKLLKQENDWYASELRHNGNINLNLFILGCPVTAAIKDLKPNTNELWACQYGDGINFRYETSTWDGLSFYLESVDVIKLFKKYFVAQRWGDDLNIEITDAEIGNILYPIDAKITEVLKTALYHREFDISINEYWGEISVAHMLQFHKHIAEKVFSLITKQLKNSSNSIHFK